VIGTFFRDAQDKTGAGLTPFGRKTADAHGWALPTTAHLARRGRLDKRKSIM